jgi:hypothetical protein
MAVNPCEHRRLKRETHHGADSEQVDFGHDISPKLVVRDLTEASYSYTQLSVERRHAWTEQFWSASGHEHFHVSSVIRVTFAP